MVFLANDILLYVDCKFFKQTSNKQEQKIKQQYRQQAASRIQEPSYNCMPGATLRVLARQGFSRTELLKGVLSEILRKGTEDTLTIGTP